MGLATAGRVRFSRAVSTSNVGFAPLRVARSSAVFEALSGEPKRGDKVSFSRAGCPPFVGGASAPVAGSSSDFPARAGAGTSEAL